MSKLNANSVEIGSITLATRQSGVSTATGEIVFVNNVGQDGTGEIQVYGGNSTGWLNASGQTASGIATSFRVETFTSSGTSPSSTLYPAYGYINSNLVYDNEMYGVLHNDSGASITFEMYVYGAGGGTGDDNNPSDYEAGSAGGGVSGTYTVAAGGKLTFMVGQTGTTTNNVRPFPDGGAATYPSEASGGGSSRVGNGLIPYPTRNNTPVTYLLIGAGGAGGGANHTSGTIGGYGGYPAGARGGGYYPLDGFNATGNGGTQTAGGATPSAGRRPAGQAGAKYYGGNAGNYPSSNSGGSGGGGGYYGGAGAGGYYARGGGGSSYVHPSITGASSYNATPGPGAANFSVVPSAGGKPSNAGNGGYDGCVIFKITQVI